MSFHLEEIMGTIREYCKKNGSLTYHAEVRLSGHPPKRASFSTLSEAKKWVETTETGLRGHSQSPFPTQPIRHDWTIEELKALDQLPLLDLIHSASTLHRTFHNPNEIQLCHLISVKTGGCSEDCKYCAQSSKYQTSITPTPMMAVEEVVNRAKHAMKEGTTRICLGAAWRQIRDSAQFNRLLEMVRQITVLGIEVCCTLGMASADQMKRLKAAGLYAYNHNLDTSPQHYQNIISSHTFNDRIKTLRHVASEGLSVCCGGIFGIGETQVDRLELLKILANLIPHPDSVPFNRLEPISGTPLENFTQIRVLDLVRLIAIARLIMPKALLRLSAGRLKMTEEEQALCFLAGANSIHTGEKLLTVPNPSIQKDQALLARLGLKPRPPFKSFQNNEENPSPVKPLFLQRKLYKREEEGTLRQLSFSNPDLIDFASNDYLGLASSLPLTKEINREFTRLVFEEGIRPSIGATGSRLLTGNQPYLEQLESTIAKYHGGESALLFNSGYAANTGLLSCIAGEEDALILDSQVHASTWDGARLSRAKNYLFRHNDLENLEKQLKRSRKDHKEVFVCVESLYSMLGDLAPLEKVCHLCEDYEAWVIVDEAHATGVLGEEGRGLVAELSDRSRVIAQIHTFGKALGCHGAAVVGSELLRNYLINHCRTFIYTTAFPLHTLVTLQCIYTSLPKFDQKRKQLDHLIRSFSLEVENSPLPIKTTSTVIQSIPIARAEEAMRISEQMRLAGLDVRAIRSPTVRKGKECFRVCLHAFNTSEEITQLMTALSEERESIFIA